MPHPPNPPPAVQRIRERVMEGRRAGAKLTADTIATKANEGLPSGAPRLSPRTVARFLGDGLSGRKGDSLEFRGFNALWRIERALDGMLEGIAGAAASMGWWRYTLRNADSMFAVNYLAPDVWDPPGEGAEAERGRKAMRGAVAMMRGRICAEGIRARRLFVLADEAERGAFARAMSWHVDGDYADPMPCRYAPRSAIPDTVLRPRDDPSAVIYTLPGMDGDTLMAAFTLDDKRRPVSVRQDIRLRKDGDDAEWRHWLLWQAYEEAWAAATPVVPSRSGEKP